MSLDPRRLALEEAAWFEEHEVASKCGREAVALDRATRRVRLDEAMAYACWSRHIQRSEGAGALPAPAREARQREKA
jgi:hypothetical protein